MGWGGHTFENVRVGKITEKWVWGGTSGTFFYCGARGIVLGFFSFVILGKSNCFPKILHFRQKLDVNPKQR